MLLTQLVCKQKYATNRLKDKVEDVIGGIYASLISNFSHSLVGKVAGMEN